VSTPGCGADRALQDTSTPTRGSALINASIVHKGSLVSPTADVTRRTIVQIVHPQLRCDPGCARRPVAHRAASGGLGSRKHHSPFSWRSSNAPRPISCAYFMAFDFHIPNAHCLVFSESESTLHISVESAQRLSTATRPPPDHVLA
jgi:hypothetical protein